MLNRHTYITFYKYLLYTKKELKIFESLSRLVENNIRANIVLKRKIREISRLIGFGYYQLIFSNENNVWFKI